MGSRLVSVPSDRVRMATRTSAIAVKPGLSRRRTSEDSHTSATALGTQPNAKRPRTSQTEERERRRKRAYRERERETERGRGRGRRGGRERASERANEREKVMSLWDSPNA